MAATVQTGGGSGVDLSGLTSGERLLIGLLSQKMRVTEPLIIGMGQSYNDGTIDLTEVKNITFEETEANTPCEILVRSPALVKSVVIQPMSTGTLDVSSYGENTRMEISTPKTGYDPRIGSFDYTSVKVTSFTTTDGKVHTASNLNY